MSGLIRAIVVLTVTASTLTFPTFNPVTSGSGETTIKRRPVASPTVPETPSRAQFQVSDLEFYLTDDGIAYIRPGLVIKVNSVTIGADRRPVVDLTFTDKFNQPLDRLGQATPGALTLSFLSAWYDPATRHYTSYITRAVKTPANSPNPGVDATQATAESNGTWTDLSIGRATYKFANALPANFDQTKTHTIGVQAYRNLQEQLGKYYYDNEEYDYRPDGQKVADQWNKINDVTSCKTCHDAETFGFHGTSARRDLKLCVMCHNPQSPDPDTGETVDMKVMAHKIHAAPDLPSGKDYIIYGNNQSIHNYSETVHYPGDVRNCARCHEGTSQSAKAPGSDLYLTKPSRAACGSCHDDINWVTGANHPAGAQTSDANCATCHVPDSGAEFDASIKGAHVIPERSGQLAGYKAEIVKVENLKAGAAPTVTFKITDKKGAAVDGTKLSTFSPILAGPTSDYSVYARENALTKGVFDAATGTTSYTFTKTLPADATGTWTFSADIYKTVNLKRADGKPDITGIRDVATNPIKYVALGTAAATPRRQVVSLALCNNCHDQLALHGGQRRVIEECVICHNPTEGDQSRRPATAGLPESVSFQRLIHRIHSGAELQQEYTVYGFGGTPINFNNIHFPGDRRNCATCHVNNSHRLPVGIGNAPVNTQRDFWAPQGSGTAACLGCHDSKDASAHAFLNTTQFAGKPAEACGVCHGATSEWSADKVHAR